MPLITKIQSDEESVNLFCKYVVEGFRIPFSCLLLCKFRILKISSIRIFRLCGIILTYIGVSVTS